MMRKEGFGLVSAVGLAMCLAAAPVWAKDHGHGKGHRKQSLEERLAEYDRRHADDHAGHRNGPRHLEAIRKEEREEIGNRLRPHYRMYCPPGLAARKYGCLPPGHAKRYVIGHALPSNTTYWEVPRDVVVMLPPPPPRAHYIWVDQDIVLVSSDNMVLDAVAILSALE